MNELGLAQTAQSKSGIDMRMVGEVAKLLVSGVNPEQLLAQGVPAEVIDAAMSMLVEQQRTQPEQQGLAGMSTPNTLMER